MLWPDDVAFFDPLSISTLKVAANHPIANLLGLCCDTSRQPTWPADKIFTGLARHANWIQGFAMLAGIPKVQGNVVQSMVLWLQNKEAAVL